MKIAGPAAEPEKQRGSVSGVVLPEEQVSASHTLPALSEASARSLDRLIALAHELPFSQGEEVVIQTFVEALATLVPGHVVTIASGEGQQRKTYRPEAPRRDSFSPASGEVPTTKMLGNLVERVVRIPEAEMTIVVAGDDASLANEDAPVIQIAHRALYVLEGARHRARMAVEIAELRAQLDERESLLTQSDKLASFGQLAAGMVHEINNPLTSILAYTDFLAKRASARQDTEDVERLRRINESANRMLKLSRDIVSYARPSASLLQPVVISSVVEQALTFCEHLFEESGVSVEKKLGDGILPVRGRPEQLAQVFVNLFTNACHAMPQQGGALAVTTELLPDETRVRVVVADNGHGIEPQNLARVFLPFFTTKDEKHGTGLGLAIVKRIVESHEGTVEVESNERGTRFSIVLPVAREA